MSGALADQIDLWAAILLMALTLLDVLVFIFGLFAISSLRSRREPSGIGLLAWIAMFALLAILWLIAIVFGFGIHGTGPRLADKLAIQAPFFILSIVALVMAIRMGVKLHRQGASEQPRQF